MSDNASIPTIDLFAGPGGLGEGFARHRSGKAGHRTYQPALSIEMDKAAHRTLQLRAFTRQFPDDSLPAAYYAYLRGHCTLDDLYRAHPREFATAGHEAWNAELGQAPVALVRKRIETAIHRVGNPNAVVLLGGPPCQPFSLAGRARNRRNTRYSEGKETRHTLYVEYLQIIADFWPAVFVMENVRGLLSAQYGGVRMFDRIQHDLRAPAKAIASTEGRGRRLTGREHTYRLHTLNVSTDDQTLYPEPDYLVRCEQHGIPQARHRLILLGVRDDVSAAPASLQVQTTVPAHRVLDDLPKLRSGFSQQDDSRRWRSFLQRDTRIASWFLQLTATDPTVGSRIQSALYDLTTAPNDRGSEFLPTTLRCAYRPRCCPGWFHDPQLSGVIDHTTRGHMAQDLWRYLFAACFADVHGRSPKLDDFPPALLPDHQNASDPGRHTPFTDRFRVQLANQPSTTIVSHIAKDGHYYIHPDPTQCRSLTVREAARLQTFPDNYKFVGNRTEQYHQVGNAVPPLLAFQIAGIVHELLRNAGLA